MQSFPATVEGSLASYYSSVAEKLNQQRDKVHGQHVATISMGIQDLQPVLIVDRTVVIIVLTQS